MNKNNILQPFIYGTLLALGIIVGYLLAGNISSSNNMVNEGKGSKLFELIDYINNNYVDEVNNDSLMEYAISGMLERLDPHSVYIPASMLLEVNEPLSGSFEGIGIQFRIERDSVMVVNTIPNGPSAKKGLRSGDRIVSVDGKNIAGIGITNEEVKKLLKGPKGSSVTLKIKRRGQKALIEIELTRDEIPTYSVDAACMLDNQTGYIKLSTFSSTTASEFHNALAKLNALGMKNLILDIRDNGGGYLNAAVSVADELIEKGKTIVYTQGLHRKEKYYKSDDGGLFEQGRVYILLNELSASASEIVAGAIQDNDRGIIIGRRSFGKGLVQEQVNLRDGSALRLTVARYYTPTGRSIQRPYDGGTEEYYLEFYERLLEDDSMAASWHNNKQDTLKYETAGGRIVYGGGGISPDTLVLKDFILSQDIRIALFGSSILFNGVFEYVDQNRAMLEKLYPSSTLFIARFSVPDELLSKMILRSVLKRELTPAENTLLKVLIKASIARELFNNESYYQIVSGADAMIQLALKLIQQ